MALINTLNEIGKAIREKTGGTELIPLKEMADVIRGISGGESIEYSSITYNEDGTVTLTQTNGTVRKMTCEYDGDKLVGLKYGNEVIPLTYEDDVLVGIGGMEVDLNNAPATSGGAALNIAYGDTEPDDTSKLWIKANEPESIAFGSDFEGVESIETIGNIPTAGYGMGCAKVGTKIYLFGGQSASSVYLDTINVFDTEIQTITTLETTLPTACSNIACASVGSKIYLFGGYNGDSLDTISVFDTETQIITILSTILPTACNSIYCASIGNKVYLLGGSNSLNTINVFDTETQIITQLSTKLPVTYSGRGYASVGSKIYLFGGYYYSMGAAYSNRIDVFDTETQTITQLSTKLPAARYSIACTNVGNKIYLFGGRNKNTHNTIFVFDASTETITTSETTLPTLCYSMSCASVGNKIYLFGGYGSNYLNTINQFSLTHELAQNSIEIITNYKNFFNIVNTDTMKVEIGVGSILIGNENNEAEVCEAYLYQNDTWVQI